MLTTKRKIIAFDGVAFGMANVAHIVVYTIERTESEHAVFSPSSAWTQVIRSKRAMHIRSIRWKSFVRPGVGGGSFCRRDSAQNRIHTSAESYCTLLPLSPGRWSCGTNDGIESDTIIRQSVCNCFKWVRYENTLPNRIYIRATMHARTPPWNGTRMESRKKSQLSYRQFMGNLWKWHCWRADKRHRQSRLEWSSENGMAKTVERKFG